MASSRIIRTEDMDPVGAIPGVTLAEGTGISIAEVVTNVATSGTQVNPQTLRTVTVSDAYSTTIAKLAADYNFAQANTTLQDITGLSFTIGTSATEIWLVEVWIEITAPDVNMDSKFGFTVPAAATMRWQGTGTSAPTAVPSYGIVATGTTPGAIIIESGSEPNATLAGTNGVAFVGKVYGGGTGGSVQFQGCQNTSVAAQLTALKGSALRATKIIA
jgi:hypothetical protein